jgi:hypothetical protein
MVALDAIALVISSIIRRSIMTRAPKVKSVRSQAKTLLGLENATADPFVGIAIVTVTKMSSTSCMMSIVK